MAGSGNALRDVVRRWSTTDQVLLIDPTSERRLTYAGLSRRSEGVGQLATSAGWSPGSRIGIATRDSYVAAELFVACIHAGLPMVPLNLDAGANHLEQVMRAGRISVVLASDDARTEIEMAAPDGVAVRDVTLDASADDAPYQEVDPEAEAFVMYTSGSTGVPKGVRLSNRNAAVAGENNRVGYEWSADDRILCPLPFWHMNACDKALGAMASGATMIVPPRFRVGEFWGWTTEHRPTVMIIVPTIAAELLQHPTPDEPASTAARAAVRYAGSSSAPLNAAVHDEFVDRFGIPMIEAFGMSETGTIFVTTPPPGTGTPGSVGRPAGWEVRIADDEGRLCAPGEVGALELRGDALTIGYDDGAAFAEALTEDGWFRTGDIGRFNDDDEFFVVGRAKEIVIKGGVNIAPREIDEVVVSHPSVVEVATVGVADDLMGQDIETFVVLTAGAAEDAVLGELSELCLDRLGVLKTPRRISSIDALPKGPGGKVQPLRLLDLIDDIGTATPRATGVGGDATDAATPMERMLHRLWSDLLAVEGLGIHENFFDRGGYSLLALECCVNLRRELRIQIPLALLFENPTVSSFAEILVAQMWLATDADNDDGGPSTADLRELADRVRELDADARVQLEQRLLDAERAAGSDGLTADAILLNGSDKPEELTTYPIFCAYGPYQYSVIAEHLRGTTDVYGLFADDETDTEEGDGRLDVAGLARRYIEAMRRAQPEGPYHLVGFSFGGRVALEMTAQLREAGEDVALLAPIDTYLGGLRPAWHPRTFARLVASRVAGVVRRRRTRDAEQAPSSAFVETVRADQARYRRWASLSHDIPAIDRPVVLFAAAHMGEGRMAASQNRWLGWNAATADVERVEYVGTHHDMVEDPVAIEIATELALRVTALPLDRPRRVRTYRHPLIDSTRWDNYRPRADDIIITTSMKAGTTWMQRIVGMLVTGSTLPVDLDAYSPWIESVTNDAADVVMEAIDRQPHRRFLKSHLPADALPFHEEVSYIVVGRDTRDVFLSMHNHYANYTPEMLRTFNAVFDDMALEPAPASPNELWPTWISTSTFPWEQDGAPFWSHHHHAMSYWRWRDLPNILFVHYDDLLTNLPGEISRVADFLGIAASDEAIASYAEAATFASMKAAGSTLLPYTNAAFSGGSATFFNRGTSSRWRSEMTADEVALYEQNAAVAMTPELKAWLEGGRHVSNPDSTGN